MKEFLLFTIMLSMTMVSTVQAEQSNQGTCYVAQKISCSTPDEKSIHFIFQTEFQKSDLAIKDCQAKTSSVVGDIPLWRATKMRDFIKEKYSHHVVKCSMPVVFFQNKNQASNSLETIQLKNQYTLDHCHKLKNQQCLTEENIEFRP